MLKEEEAENEREKYFNAKRPMQKAKKEWRVKQANTPPTHVASDGEVDWLEEGALLIKDGTSQP